MRVERRRGILVRVSADPLQEIAARHTPLLMDDALLCARCDEIWPCDSRQLLDRLDVPRIPFENALGHVVDPQAAASPGASGQEVKE